MVAGLTGGVKARGFTWPVEVELAERPRHLAEVADLRTPASVVAKCCQRRTTAEWWPAAVPQSRAPRAPQSARAFERTVSMKTSSSEMIRLMTSHSNLVWVRVRECVRAITCECKYVRACT
jgi:hypothetical protein